MCSEEGDDDSLGVQEQQEIDPNAIVLVDEAVANLLLNCGSDIDAERRCHVEEKMIEIARILGITVEGRIKEISACIRGMIDEEFGRKNGKFFLRARKSPRVIRSWLIWLL